MLRMKVRRVERGASQAQIARLAQMHPSTVSLIESGRLRPGLGQLRKLARALGVPRDQAATLLQEVGTNDRSNEPSA